MKGTQQKARRLKKNEKKGSEMTEREHILDLVVREGLSEKVFI